jgi:MoxR-like ATPase
MDPQTLSATADRLRSQIRRVVIGQRDAVDLLLTAVLSEGHVLIEGVPGTAKTLLAQTFAASLQLQYKRIQFTPDLMPADVVGTNLFNFQKNEFVLNRGPVFTEILLADEINRTPPKTQAALLQAMQERAVTIDGRTYELGPGFMVVATQNPIEQEGTYPLPEAQLDRFLFKIKIQVPPREDMIEMVRLHGHRTAMPRLQDFSIEPIADLGFLTGARASIAQIRLSDEMIQYIVDLIQATQNDTNLLFGASPRAANMAAVAARAHAALQGRDFVIPDDVQSLLKPLLAHRIVVSPGAELEGMTADRILEQVIERIDAPR